MPEDAAEACGDGRFEAGMVIADNGFQAMEAAILEAFEEFAPMDFGFGEFAGDAEDGSFALRVDADGEEHGAALDHPVLADLFVAGIEDEIADGAQGPLAPLLENGV